MFGNEFTDIPIVQVSIDSSLSTDKNWALGKAVSKLRLVSFSLAGSSFLTIAIREEGILVLSGGLTIHNLRDFASFDPNTAQPAHKEFDKAILAAVGVADVGFARSLS